MTRPPFGPLVRVTCCAAALVACCAGACAMHQQLEPAPWSSLPRVDKPTAAAAARTADCLAPYPDRDGPENRVRFGDVVCVCVPTVVRCSGTPPPDPDEHELGGVPLGGTGYGLGHYLCTSDDDAAAAAVDARGCPLRMPAEGDPCPPPAPAASVDPCVWWDAENARPVERLCVESAGPDGVPQWRYTAVIPPCGPLQ